MYTTIGIARLIAFRNMKENSKAINICLTSQFNGMWWLYVTGQSPVANDQHALTCQFTKSLFLLFLFCSRDKF